MAPDTRTVSLYTKRWCGYCFAARRLLSKREIDFEEISLDGKPELRHSLSASNGNWPTVPMIFVGEHFIGGYNELSRLNRQGRLQMILEGGA